MFTLLSREHVSSTPGRDALYASLTIHVCTFVALTWFSFMADTPVRFKLITVHAGTPEPVRQPQPIFLPVRAVRISPNVPTGPTRARPDKTEKSSSPRNNEDNRGDYTPTTIPPDLIASLETTPDTAEKPGLPLASIRTVPSLSPFREDPLPDPPEAPPGDLDVKPPPVIGGHVEAAVLIEKIKPVYPFPAKTARVEGVVVLEGTVSEEGKVVDVHVVSGHPMLVEAAIHAVKKWKYRPAKLNGQLISCPVHVEVRFALHYPGE
jgi:TonB family protein